MSVDARWRFVQAPLITFLVERGKSPVVFVRLRWHFQWRDRLRMVIGYRRKDLESLERQGEGEAERSSNFSLVDSGTRGS